MAGQHAIHYALAKNAFEIDLAGFRKSDRRLSNEQYAQPLSCQT
jgi:hypothetical protein